MGQMQPMMLIGLLVIGLLFKVQEGSGHRGNKHSMGKNTMVDDFHNHPCRRPCHAHEKPMLCEYKLEISWYTTMGRACFYCPNVMAHCSLPGCIPGSGTQRGVIVANRCLPGPSIEVCLGDQIRVSVMNMMQNAESVTIHWHGMPQRKSPYMDGSAYYSQCPILPGSTFVYDFEAEVAGTYFYHSHSGVQRADGLSGPLIIREPHDPQQALYDKDSLRSLMFRDWFPSETAINRFATYNYGNANFNPPQILINGVWPTPFAKGDNGNKTLPSFPVPLPPIELHLNAKKRYRIRMISDAFWLTPVKIEVTGHVIIVIASDGIPIVPVATRFLTMMPAETFDIVLCYTGQKVHHHDGVFWMLVRGLGDSEEADAKSFAKIVYKRHRNPKPRSIEMCTGGVTDHVLREVNYWNWERYAADDEGLKGKKVSQLRSMTNHPRVDGKPDFKIPIIFDFELVNNPVLYPIKVVRQDSPVYSANYPMEFLTPRLNHITNKMPPVPLLTQAHEVPRDQFCNAEHRMCPPDRFCECIHVIKVPLGSLVELILIDSGFSDDQMDMNHPLHLHGYHFRVVGMSKMHLNLTLKEVMELDRSGLIERNLKYAPLKNVIGVPTGGFTVIRFIADNPGVWPFHCHLDFHMEMGMAMAFIVGERSDLPPPPPHFPRCHASWSPPDESDSSSS